MTTRAQTKAYARSAASLHRTTVGTDKVRREVDSLPTGSQRTQRRPEQVGALATAGRARGRTVRGRLVSERIGTVDAAHGPDAFPEGGRSPPRHNEGGHQVSVRIARAHHQQGPS